MGNTKRGIIMKRKAALSLLVFICILSSVSIGAYAAIKQSLIINGKKVTADIKVISGTPYIPLTALTKNLKNVTIKYDAKAGTIKIDEPKPAKEPAKDPAKAVDNSSASKPANDGLTAATPAPIGTEVPVIYNDWGKKNNFTIKVEQVIRGSEALTMVQQANKGEDVTPQDGDEYMLVKLSFTLLKSSTVNSFSVHSATFPLVSSTTGKIYPYTLIEPTSPAFSKEVHAGETLEGWGLYIVKKDDPNPIVRFEYNNGAWLKTN
jgi:hypothetical protein